MKGVGSISPGMSITALPTQPVAAPKKPGGFDAVWTKVGEEVSKNDLFGLGLHQELTKVGQAIAGGRDLSARELLLYQVRAGQLGLRVELVSKVAESGLQTVRKLQQG